jgi:hypothetical protein
MLVPLGQEHQNINKLFLRTSPGGVVSLPDLRMGSSAEQYSEINTSFSLVQRY